jgi:hypothetical protein
MIIKSESQLLQVFYTVQAFSFHAHYMPPWHVMSIHDM